MRLAYADPPYPRQSKRHYGDHPDYAGEVDHAALVAQLEAYDGWAISTSAQALQEVLELCPKGVRVAVWHRTNSEPPGNRGSWWWSWEPVIVSPARGPEWVTRDLLSCSSPSGFLGGKITGQKPPTFSEWVFSLMGARPGDALEDLFPGSGAVTRAWDRYERQLRFVPDLELPDPLEPIVVLASQQRERARVDGAPGRLTEGVGVASSLI